MIRLGANDITGLSINKQSNQAVYLQWADVNATVPQYRIRLWYNGSLRVDTILSGQDAANDYYIWYVDCCTYALMPGDVIKGEVTPYASNAAIGSPFTASATIQSSPAAQEPTQVVQSTPVQNTGTSQSTVPSQSPSTAPAVPTPQPVPPTQTAPAGMPDASSAQAQSIGAWIGSHLLLLGAGAAGIAYAVHKAKK